MLSARRYPVFLPDFSPYGTTFSTMCSLISCDSLADAAAESIEASSAISLSLNFPEAIAAITDE